MTANLPLRHLRDRLHWLQQRQEAGAFVAPELRQASEQYREASRADGCGAGDRPGTEGGMSRHTKRNWKRCGNTVYELNAKGVNRWWLHVQSAGADDCADEAECKRIARLVGAAPNLLAALKLTTSTPCNCRGCVAGRAAIARAEGMEP